MNQQVQQPYLGEVFDLTSALFELNHCLDTEFHKKKPEAGCSCLNARLRCSMSLKQLSI